MSGVREQGVNQKCVRRVRVRTGTPQEMTKRKHILLIIIVLLVVGCTPVDIEQKCTNVQNHFQWSGIFDIKSEYYEDGTCSIEQTNFTTIIYLDCSFPEHIITTYDMDLLIKIDRNSEYTDINNLKNFKPYCTIIYTEEVSSDET